MYLQNDEAGTFFSKVHDAFGERYYNISEVCIVNVAIRVISHHMHILSARKRVFAIARN